MIEYIKFYTKNLSNFTILLLIGVVIAILDITIRNVVRDVYLNVRENMRRGREGMKTKASSKKRTGGGGGDEDGSGGGGGGGGGGDGENEDCPKNCNAVEALRKKLTGLIENAAKLQNDIQQNNKKIESQQKIIENMQKSVQKLVEKSK
jgi:hypothetical protein